MSFQEMKVPRRPSWDASMSAEELNLHEREAFLEWRREIARLVYCVLSSWNVCTQVCLIF